MATGAIPAVKGLRLLLKPGARREHVCEICGAAVTAEHRHMLQAGSRRLLCACDSCAFRERGYRLVPTRYARSSAMRIAREQWDALDIPVDPVFLIRGGDRRVWRVCYPGPAGVTESRLPLEAWPDLVAAHPWLESVLPDVEAVLVRRDGDVYACAIVPISDCYELAGRIRASWNGFSGGEAVAIEVERFFGILDGRIAGISTPSAGPVSDAGEDR